MTRDDVRLLSQVAVREEVAAYKVDGFYLDDGSAEHGMRNETLKFDSVGAAPQRIRTWRNTRSLSLLASGSGAVTDPGSMCSARH